MYHLTRWADHQSYDNLAVLAALCHSATFFAQHTHRWRIIEEGRKQFDDGVSANAEIHLVTWFAIDRVFKSFHRDTVLDSLPMPVVSRILVHDEGSDGSTRRESIRRLARRYYNYRNEQWLAASAWLMDRTCEDVASLIGQFLTAGVTPRTCVRNTHTTREWLSRHIVKRARLC